MTSERSPAVTVYVLCYNYGRFLPDAIESVRAQIFADWELIVLDDGSTDDTASVLERYGDEPRIRILTNGHHVGLRGSANRCIRESRGSYVLRLDADDVLLPHCFDVFMREATRSPDVSMFFSDYYYIDESGDVIGVEAFLDGARGQTFPPHGSGSFVRRDAFDRIAFYDASLDATVAGAAGHGHELWLKVRQAGLSVQHVPLPLFSYRQHGPTVSSDVGRLIRAQGAVKRRLARDLTTRERVVSLIPVRNTYAEMPDLPFMTTDGQTLIERAVCAAREAPSVSDVLVTTESDEVAAFMASRLPDVRTFVRPPELRRDTASIRDVVADVAARSALSDDVIVCLLSILTPRRTGFHVQKAIDNFLLYDVDSVVAVHEDRNPIYQMGPSGLRPVNGAFHTTRLRREREAVYVDTGAVRVFRVRNLKEAEFMGGRIGHSLMTAEDARQIESPADFDLLDPVVVHLDR